MFRQFLFVTDEMRADRGTPRHYVAVWRWHSLHMTLMAPEALVPFGRGVRF